MDPTSALTVPDRPRVAVVRSDNRRGAAAQALALIADDLRRRVTPEVLVKPNLVSHRRPLPSTHPDTFSAALDAVFAAGAARAVVAEGATDATAGYRDLGLAREAAGRPVRFFDINRDEHSWESLSLALLDGAPIDARLSATVANAGCRVSLAVAKTHVCAMATLSLKNMLSSLHPADRVRMHGHRGGDGATGWRSAVVKILKRDDAFVNLLTRTLGRVRRLEHGLLGGDDFSRLTSRDLAFLRSVVTLSRNLATLAGRVGPHISVVDGFVAMHREGPRHGTPIRLGTVIAGTDAVAVDVVAAAVMGFEPRSIAHLALAEAAGLGVADLDAIEIVGDPIDTVRRHCIPHSNHRVQRHWPRLLTPPSTPHIASRRPAELAKQ